MNKPLYEQQSTSYTREEIKQARWRARFLGLCFIAVGVWAIWTNLPLARTLMPIISALTSAFGKGDGANILYGLCIGMGVLIVCISFLKPYGARK